MMSIKNSFTKKIWLIVIFVVTVTLIIGGMFLFFPKTDNLSEEAQKTVSRFLDAYKSKNERANSYLTLLAMDHDPITYEGYQGYCAEKINYKIIDVSKDDESEIITVTVDIQNIDLIAVLNELNKETIDSDEEIIEYFNSIIQSADAPTRVYKCDIKCKEYPTGMKILFDAELSNALLGGYSAFVAGNNE